MYWGTSPEYFSSNGVQKGVLLTRYAALMQDWTIDQRQHMQYSAPWNPCVNQDNGIVIQPLANFSQWERQSLPLVVTNSWKSIFNSFSGYFQQQMNAVEDNTLEQELYILNKLTA